ARTHRLVFRSFGSPTLTTSFLQRVFFLSRKPAGLLPRGCAPLDPRAPRPGHPGGSTRLRAPIGADVRLLKKRGFERSRGRGLAAAPGGCIWPCPRQGGVQGLAPGEQARRLAT